jgi:GNAT superfamily N-acetyltransferase
MHIREALPEDNEELQRVQAQCPQGTSLIVSTVNTPDFFARAKPYESYKVYVACEDEHIVGSMACAVREGTVNGKINRVGYEFQAFTSPSYRRKGIAKKLHQHIENHLRQHDAVLSYCLLMEGNFPSIKLVERQGFKPYRELVMPALAVYKEMDVQSMGRIRSVTPDDLTAVAELLNTTWQGHELYQPTSADSLSQLIERIPVYDFENILILEDENEIVACLGFWDWSKITKITVHSLSSNIKMIKLMMDITRIFRPMPHPPSPGEILKQFVLTPIAFKNPKDLAVLFRYVNNIAAKKGIRQIFYICEKDHEMLKSMKGFTHIDTKMYLYIKPLQQNISMSNNMVFIDGIDL